jgi:hypothetical protein
MYDAPKDIGMHESAWFTYRGVGGNPGGNDRLEPRVVTRRLSSIETSWKRPCLTSGRHRTRRTSRPIAWREPACGITVTSREQPNFLILDGLYWKPAKRNLPKTLGAAEAGV